MAFMSMFYIGYVAPNYEKIYNIMEVINEEFVLVCAYLSITLISFSSNKDMSDAIGYFMKYVL